MQINLTDQQKWTFNKFLEGNNIFISGPGGSGKSTFIHTIINYLKTNTKKKYQVCSLTGCAAMLLKCQAKTIHSWSGIGIVNSSNETIINKVVSNKQKSQKWKST